MPVKTHLNFSRFRKLVVPINCYIIVTFSLQMPHNLLIHNHKMNIWWINIKSNGLLPLHQMIVIYILDNST